ncbi:MAG: fluoride efflux transporter CrcB [Actinomycetes bacterium]
MTAAHPSADQGLRLRRHVVPPGAIAAVAVGGALGAPARYVLGRALRPVAGFPLATLAVNLSGALILGLLVVLLGERITPRHYVRQFFGTGVLGAFTTYSTFAVETDLLVRHAHIGVAVGYVVATIVGGFACAAVGAWVARVIPLRGRAR